MGKIKKDRVCNYVPSYVVARLEGNIIMLAYFLL